jgi:hypothetical protein
VDARAVHAMGFGGDDKGRHKQMTTSYAASQFDDAVKKLRILKTRLGEKQLAETMGNIRLAQPVAERDTRNADEIAIVAEALRTALAADPLARAINTAIENAGLEVTRKREALRTAAEADVKALMGN